MKNILVAVLVVAVVGLGAFSAHQHSQIDQLQSQLAEAESRRVAIEDELKQKNEAIENANLAAAKAQLLQKTLTDTAAAAAEQTKQVEHLKQSLDDAQTNNPGSALAGMLKDPKMKEMMKAQQKAFMGPMIDKNYAALFQQLNLSSEQAAYMKDLIQQKMLAGADMGMSMLGEDLTAEQRQDLAKQVKDQNDAFNAQIKELLGDDNYKTFEGYEKSMPDRMTLGQFRDQMAGSESALSSAQEQQMIQLMSDERTGFKWTTDYSNPNPAEKNFAEMFNEDRLNQYAEERQRYDEQVLARAKQFLNPGQLKSFGDFLESQRKMQEVSMKMAGQMFGKKK